MVPAYTLLTPGRSPRRAISGMGTTTAMPFVTRIVMGGVCGAAVGLAAGQGWMGAVAGAVGAVLGTFGGAAARARLAAAFGRDLPAALLEDIVAIGGGIAIMALLP